MGPLHPACWCRTGLDPRARAVIGLSMLSRLKRSKKMLPLGQGKGLHPLPEQYAKDSCVSLLRYSKYRNYTIRNSLHDVKFSLFIIGPLWEGSDGCRFLVNVVIADSHKAKAQRFEII